MLLKLELILWLVVVDVPNVLFDVADLPDEAVSALVGTVELDCVGVDHWSELVPPVHLQIWEHEV